MLHLVVHGRVQGVGFRWFVLERARELGISGWVRNRADGCVEVAASGQVEALERLRRFLQEGPPGAHVAQVEEVTGGADVPLVGGFTILR
ncbi:MAG TPA: acylphosphatase [Gemmatimonadaceae bacterium]|nr:acylphosphatase [Gemmatimonadaceae bacterium]